MLFNDGNGFVVDLTAIATGFVEKCHMDIPPQVAQMLGVPSQTESVKYCIRYVTCTNQISVRPYSSQEERDAVYERCVMAMQVWHVKHDRFDEYMKESTMRAQEFGLNHLEKHQEEDERGW